MDYFPTYQLPVGADDGTRDEVEALHAEPEPVELAAIIDVCVQLNLSATLANEAGWDCGFVSATGAYRLR